MPSNEDGTFTMSAVEKKFAAAVEKAQPLIEEKLEEATKALDAVIKLSEKHGVPVSIYLAGGALKNEYVPESFEKKKFDEIEDMYELGEELKVELPYIGGGYAGWQQSYC